MDYNEALKYLNETLKYGSKLGLHNISCLLELMSNPHKKLKYVHVAGTNGKGSTLVFISSILSEQGYRVGMFTSPYLERITERIRINDREIPKNKLAEITSYVKHKADLMVQQGQNHPTEFEIVTAIAFEYFCREKCDIVVLEVGMGGRFDSTNVIDTPLVSVITTISYDHVGILGDTLPQIAFEKAGIIKHGGDVLVYPQCREVEKVFTKTACEMGAAISIVDFDGIKIKDYNLKGQKFDYRFSTGECFKDMKITLLGDHQVKNAVMALYVTKKLKQAGFNISDKAIGKGLEKARWSGRLEVLHKQPLFIIDGAHNVEGAHMLRDTLDKYFPEKERIFIVGILRDKDFPRIMEILIPTAKMVIAITPLNERALPAEELANFAGGYCNNVIVNDTIEDAVRTSLQYASKNDLICSFGSLYYIGAIRKIFKYKVR